MFKHQYKSVPILNKIQIVTSVETQDCASATPSYTNQTLLLVAYLIF